MKKKIIVIGILLIVIGVAIMLTINVGSDINRNLVSEETQITEPSVPNQAPIITENGAIRIVTKQLPGSKAADIMEFSQEYIDGGWTYDGTINYPKKKVAYAFQIDADLGTLLKWEPIKSK